MAPVLKEKKCAAVIYGQISRGYSNRSATQVVQRIRQLSLSGTIQRNGHWWAFHSQYILDDKNVGRNRLTTTFNP